MQKSNIDYTLSEQQYIQIDNPSNDFELYSRIHWHYATEIDTSWNIVYFVFDTIYYCSTSNFIVLEPIGDFAVQLYYIHMHMHVSK